MVVKRVVLMNPAFGNALGKLYPQDMKLAYRRALLKLVKAYDVESKDIREICKGYAESEDGSKQIMEFLETSVEMPSIPSALLDDENLKLSTQDLFFLEHVTSE